MKKKNYSYDERMKAVQLFIKYDLSPSAVIHELGYPSRNRLRAWYREYAENGTLIADNERMTKYTAEQRRTAVAYYLDHGRSVSRTIKALGYPKKTTLCDWLKEDLTPEQRKWHCKAGSALVRYSEEQKQDIVIEYLAKEKTPTEITRTYGISPTTVYKWRDKYLTEGQIEKMPKERNISDNPEELKTQIIKLQEQAEELELQVHRLRLERDVLEKAAEIIKKDQGINLKTMTNREKAIVIDALRDKYNLKELLTVFGMAKSSYCYQKAAMRAPDKYADLRIKIQVAFNRSRKTYGYRRIYSVLKSDNIRVSEKVIRKLMREDELVVYQKKRRKYSSYKGEITPAVENLINRDFHADKPNEKWLTDITEFHIPAGKIYLSPIIDCFDGLPVSWTIGTSPDADLANTMLDGAVAVLNDDEHPVVHSDRGCHYRWPGWIERMESAGLTRSMSKKGCSPDNSACEGFFGRVKNEMFYNCEWDDVSVTEFIDTLDEYLNWYAEERIKIGLGGLSPIQYRKKLGLINTEQKECTAKNLLHIE